MDIKIPADSTADSAIFSRLRVKDAMRFQTVSLTQEKSIATAIQTMIKYKTDSLLIISGDGSPAGVVTKTEIMGAYYAEMELTTILADIMGSPVISCMADETLESALVRMQDHAIHRLYVVDSSGLATGTLAYPDIVGTLYRYCCSCEFGLNRRKGNTSESILRYTVKDAMNTNIVSVLENMSIGEVIEQLASFRLGALLVMSRENIPLGVISKTDIALAYKRNLQHTDAASKIINKPIIACSDTTSLEDGIRKMIFSEVGRLFVYTNTPEEISGVLSLSDTARIRSGSCQACSSSRIEIKKDL